MNILKKILGAIGLSTVMVGTLCIFGFGIKAFANPNTSAETAMLIVFAIFSCIIAWGAWFIFKYY